LRGNRGGGLGSRERVGCDGGRRLSRGGVAPYKSQAGILLCYGTQAGAFAWNLHCSERDEEDESSDDDCGNEVSNQLELHES